MIWGNDIAFRPFWRMCRELEGKKERGNAISQFFTSYDYMLALPMIMLSLFGWGRADRPDAARRWKRVNAWTALVGIIFSAAAVVKIQLVFHSRASNSLGVLAG